MINKKWLAALLIFTLIFGYLFTQLFSASYQVQKSISTGVPAENSHKTKPHFVLISQELDNPYWRTIEKGARAAAKKAGADIEYLGPIRINPKDQIEYIDKAIAAKVDGILVQGSDESEYVSVIQKAQQQNIPVLTIDTDSAASGRKTYVGSDNLQAGKQLGQVIVQSMKEHGVVGIIIGSKTAINHRLRLQGLLSVFHQYPNIKVHSIKSSDISQFQAAQQAELILKTDPSIDVMVGTSALDGVGIVQAAKGLKRNNLQVFGFDDLPETRKAIAQGDIEAVAVQQPYKMGAESIRILAQLRKGKKVARVFYTKISIMNRDTLKAEENK